MNERGGKKEANKKKEKIEYCHLKWFQSNCHKHQLSHHLKFYDSKETDGTLRSFFPMRGVGANSACSKYINSQILVIRFPFDYRWTPSGRQNLLQKLNTVHLIRSNLLYKKIVIHLP